MLRALSFLLVFAFIFVSNGAESQTSKTFPTNPGEIVEHVNSGDENWQADDSLRFEVLHAFISTKQKELPQFSDSSWEIWLESQRGLPYIEANIKLAVFRARQGNFSLAKSCLQLANGALISSSNKTEKWHASKAEYLDAKAEVEWMSGHPLLAIDALNLALKPELGNQIDLSPAMRARMNNNMGILQWHLGEMSEALIYFNQALTAYKHIHGETHPKTGRCYNNLGVVLLHLGDMAQARIKFEKALEIAEEDLASFGLRSLIHNNLGIIYLSENEVQKALDHFASSFKELEKGQVGNTKYELDVWRFSAEAYLTKNDTASALEAMDHALKILNSAEGELGIHGAELYSQLSQIEPANRKAHLLAAAACMEKEGVTSHADYAGIQLALGDYFLEAGKKDSAQHFYETGHKILLQKLREGETEKQLITSFSRKARWEFEVDSYSDLTKAYWDSSLYYMDVLRTSTPFPDSRDNFFKIGNDVYPEALDQATKSSLEKTKHTDESGESIFRLIEHSKSFTFTEHLLNQRMDQGTEEGRLNRSRIAEYNFLRERINQLEAGSEKELELRARFNALAEAISESANSIQSTKKSSPPSLKDVQAELLDDEVFVTYYMGPTKSYAFATQKDAYLWWSMPTDTLQTLLAQQKKLLNNLETALNPDFDLPLQTNLTALYGFLIAPMVDQFEMNTLFYSLHGQLYGANLNCLVSEWNSGPIQTWNYLIKTTNLSSIASSWQIVQRAQKGQWKTNTTGVWASDFSRQNQLSTLKNAIVEAEIIDGIRSSDLYLNARCNKHSFIEKSGMFEVVHLALHGNAGSFTQEGCLYFESEDSTEVLKLSELMGLGIANQLTVLGSCKGGSGSWALGETANSLSKAFLTAGSKQVIHSKWELEDAVNMELMRTFYLNLSQGFPPAKALREAQLSWLNSSNELIYMHPHFWSGLELSGPDPKTNGSALDVISWKGGLSFAALILVGIWLFFRTKR